MSLSEEEKKRIEEEEKYREKIKKELNKAPWWKPKGKLTWLVLIFIAISILFGSLMDSSNNKSPQQNTLATTETISQKDKDALVQTFCDERSKSNIRSVNLEDFIAMYEANGGTVTLRPANGVYPTTENCKKIVDVCLKQWNAENCKKIAESKIWIGMTDDQLILSWGLPNDRNDSIYSFGVRSQWVYGTFKPYVYLEGKDKNSMTVTSWQD